MQQTRQAWAHSSAAAAAAPPARACGGRSPPGPSTQRNRELKPRALPGSGADGEATPELLRAFAHAGKPLPSGADFRIEPVTIILHQQVKRAPRDAEFNSHARRARVAGDVGDRLLEDEIEMPAA